MKKILLGLGTLGMIITPMVAVISCGANEENLKDKKIADDFIQSLTVDNFKALVDSTKLNISVTKSTAFLNLKTLQNYNNLSDHQKGLIHESDFAIDDSMDGTSKITITNHGSLKVIIISGFLTKSQEAQKDVNLVLSNFQQANLEVYPPNSVEAASGDFDAKILQNLGRIKGDYPATVPDGIKITYELKGILAGNSGQLIVTISKAGAQSKTFNILIDITNVQLINVNSEKLVKDNITFNSGTIIIGANIEEINYDVSSISGWNNITDIVFERPENITVIGNQSFVNARFVNLDFSKLVNLKRIGESAFSGSPLQTLNINGLKKLEYIGISSFANAWNLNDLDLSGLVSLTTIGEHAFATSGLKTINLIGDNNLEIIGQGSFKRTLKDAILKMPESAWKKLVYNTDSNHFLDKRIDIFGNNGETVKRIDG